MAILNGIVGREVEFAAAFADAQRHFQSVDGYLGHEFRKCLEQANRYISLVHWRQLEDHTGGRALQSSGVVG